VTAPLRLGLRANLAQFTLLVIVNAFVGAMVGMERSILPAIAEQDFHLAARTAVLSFIVVFGLSKALTNYAAGRLSDRWGRKHVLVGGWLVAAPVPFLLMWAPSWNWVLAANVLLGVSQGLTWSTTVIMKIDLAGPARRGLAMGFNEFAGYLAVAGSALATGYVASTWGLRPEPFYLGVGFVGAGLLLSLLLVRDTHAHARHEASGHAVSALSQRMRGLRRVAPGPLRPHRRAGPAHAARHALRLRHLEEGPREHRLPRRDRAPTTTRRRTRWRARRSTPASRTRPSRFTTAVSRSPSTSAARAAAATRRCPGTCPRCTRSIGRRRDHPLGRHDRPVDGGAGRGNLERTPPP
jgi:hypothetical protein